MKPLHIAPLAEDELREARDWYEAQGPGLGRRFVDAVDAVLVGIHESPGRTARDCPPIPLRRLLL